MKKRDQHFDRMSRAQSNEKDNHATLFMRFNLGNSLKFSSSSGNNSEERNDDIKLLQRSAT